jgi:hypothetical protein
MEDVEKLPEDHKRYYDRQSRLPAELLPLGRSWFASFLHVFGRSGVEVFRRVFGVSLVDGLTFHLIAPSVIYC